jgi:hypothetical protein
MNATTPTRNTFTIPTNTADLTLSQTISQRLLELPFDAFAALITRLLPQLGYRKVQPTGRRDFRGRNGHDGPSGYDLTAKREGRTVLVQLKQFGADHAVYQGTIDTLREALLITTGSISPTVDREAHRLAQIAPVVTLSGAELAEKLVRHHIGITHQGAIDEPLLHGLTVKARGNRPGDSTSPAFIVTVGIQRVRNSRLRIRQ